METNPLVQHVRKKLCRAFATEKIEIIDESARHAGHAGSGGGGHLRLHIVSEKFRGLSPLERHRAVYEALSEEMKGAIHALSIDANVPEE